MHVLVTGGAGFLGSHLCDRLITRGNFVTCVDNLSTGRICNIEHLLPDPDFRFVEDDVSTGAEINDAVDVIVHLASPAAPADYSRLPLQTLAAGSRGTENSLLLAYQNNARFILASTSEIYGDPLLHPQSEDYWGNVNPIGPRSVYDEAKRFSEALTFAYRRTLNVNAGVLRIFNTYGPRMRPDDGRVVTTFIAQALSNTPLTIYGDGTQTRSFCYVDDLIRGMIFMIDSTDEGPINLGNPDERSVSELAELVLRITGSTSRIDYHPYPIDDPVRRRPVISRAMERLGWRPEIHVEEGLRRTADWLKTRLQGVDAVPALVPHTQIDGQLSNTPESIMAPR
ncbi:MAG: UDP-glucuronic acid decarboxylase family protein [Pseudonocardiaceae bacterium]